MFWVLILAIAHIGTGAGVTSQQFPTEQACNEALLAAKAHWGRDADGICIRVRQD
jgi:hypothetical protein